ncbi:PREDICTED: uncharacterized protein LOC107093257 isoform X1 [Cyprinodon variegatus]|uniref:Uncharacterized LOC107093257 n=1 Tax=Cyprinodon variegatus TaxID=28743 RepID=A0A3Q2DKD4_CYPVA|nr:PREDICTED: uncharacterized protein LOC107093257 isoform X1 [Cyprinodon variegatus]
MKYRFPCSGACSTCYSSIAAPWPQRKHRNMDLISKPRSKSVVWTYFGLKADENGQPLNSGEAICRLCRKIVLAKGGNTTNLRSHLKRRHQADFCELTSFATAVAGLDLNHEELNEDVPLTQTPSNCNYVPDAVVPPGEPWLHGGPSRAVLSLPACLSLSTDGSSTGEEQATIKVYAKCQLQQGVLFGPFLGEVCKGQLPSNLQYAWAIREDSAFTYVDASDENKSNWMRYVTYTSSEDEHNLMVFQFYRHIYYKVARPICEGEELKVWMGKDYASLLGLGMSDNAKCEIGEKETVLRLLQDIQLVTLPEPSSTSLWSDSSQSQSPMPVISEVTTVSNPEAANEAGSVPGSAFPPVVQSPFMYTSSTVTEKYDFLPGSEKLLSNPNAHQHSAWLFFGLEPDPTGRPLDRNMAVCKLCMERVSCGGGAADLQNHLTLKHHLKPRDITKDRVLATGQRIVPVMPPTSLHSSPPTATSAKVINAIASFIIRDLQSPTLVEGKGFKQLLHTLLPSYKESLTSQHLLHLLRDHHIKAKISLIQQLKRRTSSLDMEEISDYTAPIEVEPRRPGRPPNHLRVVSNFVTLSVDVWLHSWQGSHQHYLTMWAHYIDDDFNPHNLALATERLEKGGANELSLQMVEMQVRAMAQEWGVNQQNLVLLGMEGKHRIKLPPIKTEKGLEAPGSAPHPNSTTFLEKDDSASPEEPQASSEHFSEGLPSVPCFFSAVQGCIEEVMLHPGILKTLGQFQDLLSTLLLPPSGKRGFYHHHARKLLLSLSKAEQERVKLWAHCQPSWNELYPLLNSLIKHKSLICDIIKDVNQENIAREETASESLDSCHANSTSNTPSVGLPIPRLEWKLVEELCLVLKPLDVACRTLAKEAFPRLSLVKPILTGLLSRHLVPRPSDSSSILKEVKRMMRRSLASCYDSPTVNRLLCVACSLDPQFHGLGFMDDKEQVATFDWLKKEAVRIAKEDRKSGKANQMKRSSSPVSPESDSEILRRSKRLKECPPINFRDLIVEDEFSDAGENDDGDPSDPACHAGLSGMEFLLGDLFCSTPRSRQSSVEESVDMEMSVFRADRGASLGVEPLQWWRTKAGQFPLLAAVARVYMAAPAVAGNAAQDFVQEGPETTNRKRSAIPPDSLDAILFLHHNRISTADGGQE